MAKRRRLPTPSADDLTRIEEEFRRETSPRRASPAAAPIAQIAAETAEALEVRPAGERVQSARDKADAERLRAALDQGLVMQELPLAEIAPDSMIRDRTVMDEAELTELQNSIAAHGLRLPIEVYELADPEAGGRRFGLLSGYRRYLAMERLHAMLGGEKFGTIKAVIRDPEAMGGGFVAMVEENEVRATLSPYERGRIAVIAAQNGAFVNAEAAVDTLFATASKAKRSKIRSFAQVFEELGDLLRFPETLSERQGLQIASALRAGAEAALRDALEDGPGDDPEAEWAALLPVLEAADRGPKDVRRGGRPRKQPPARRTAKRGQTERLSTGWTLQVDEADGEAVIRIGGRPLAGDVLEDVLRSIRGCLDYKG